MDADLHRIVLLRCRGLCECGCGDRVPPGEVDHFFGRAKASENIATVWVLSVRCHYAKTRNSPSNAEWQRRFIAHLDRQLSGRDPEHLPVARALYTEAKHRAEARLDFVEARGTLGAALAVRR